MPEHIDTSFCTRCGACKAPCPTYDLNPDETMTARGRLRLVEALAEGRIKPSQSLKDRLGSCLLCGRCTDRCPAGVDIPEILYQGRELLFGNSRPFRLAGSPFLSPAGADRAMRWAGRLQEPVRSVLKHTSRFRPIPKIAETPFRVENQVFKPDRPRGRVAFFVGCSVNYLFPEIGDDLVAVLLHFGYEVVAIRGEVCCGAPHREIGQTDQAVQLARKNLDIFRKVQAEAIVTACPTCALTLKVQYPKLLPDAAEFADRVQDVQAFLASRLDRGFGTAGLGRVAYHDPCHLLGDLSVQKEPRMLLQATGTEIAELGGDNACCGFGGVFGFTHYDLSQQIGDLRRKAVRDSGVGHLVTSCPGCILQFQDALKGEGVKVWHTIEVLRRAIAGGEPESDE